jgi:hypothetical protein
MGTDDKKKQETSEEEVNKDEPRQKPQENKEYKMMMKKIRTVELPKHRDKIKK